MRRSDILTRHERAYLVFVTKRYVVKTSCGDRLVMLGYLKSTRARYVLTNKGKKELGLL